MSTSSAAAAGAVSFIASQTTLTVSIPPLNFPQETSSKRSPIDQALVTRINTISNQLRSPKLSEEQKEALERKLANLKRERAFHNYERVRSERDEARSSALTLTEKVEALRQNNSTLSSLLSEKQTIQLQQANEIERLKSLLAQTEKDFSSFRKRERDSNTSSTEIQQLKTAHTKLKSELETAQESAKRAKLDQEFAVQTLAQTQDRIKRADRELDSALRRNAELKQQVESLTKQIRHNEREMDGLKEENRGCCDEIDELNQLLAQYQAKLIASTEESQPLLAKIKELETRLVNAEAEKEALTIKIHELCTANKNVIAILNQWTGTL